MKISLWHPLYGKWSRKRKRSKLGKNLVQEVNNSVSTNICNLLDLLTISYLSHNTPKIKTQL